MRRHRLEDAAGVTDQSNYGASVGTRLISSSPLVATSSRQSPYHLRRRVLRRDHSAQKTA